MYKNIYENSLKNTILFRKFGVRNEKMHLFKNVFAFTIFYYLEYLSG